MQQLYAYEGRPCVDMKLSCVLDCVQYSFPHMECSVLIPCTKNVETLNFGCHLHELNEVVAGLPESFHSFCVSLQKL
jgi:hypothetical protein